uniref:Glucoamylase n=1 Tax=Thermosporothrix sp. COM3 TaxID=2490863 RepID=A0A455SE35_9CHLR|nr:glucoamylase [Thermosporothrix sp. COM3]
MSEQPATYLPIEDHALIGDLHTVALVGIDGSIDWCCLPRFDSPAVFCSLLDANKGGFFRISPTEQVKCRQLYLPETNILLTRFLSTEGVAELTDFMPIKEAESTELQHFLVRALSIIHGSLTFTIHCRPTFDYARMRHKVHLVDTGAIFESKQITMGLASPIPLEEDGHGGVKATLTLHDGDTIRFVLSSGHRDGSSPRPLDEQEYNQSFRNTAMYWHSWLSQCLYQGRWRDVVQRSALVLKLLTYAPTGALLAAATTSLPESVGGARNWDYRYTWIRDASFTLDSLLSLGFTQEAEAFMKWLDNRCHELKEGGTLQPMYGINGQQTLTEITLDHLEGYRKSRPVRIGNGAYTQKQLDIYGEMLDALYIYNRYDAISYDLWSNLLLLLEWLEKHWEDPDEGIWEVRGGPKQFVHSRLMSWVAFDRATRIARLRGWPAPINRWIKMRSRIYQQIMQRGWSQEKQSFVQYYGSEAIDASSLLLMLTHFTGTKEPRVLSTLRRLKNELASGALVRRYLPQYAADDGLGSQEGTFSACSFWFVQNLALAGHLEEARLLLEKLLSYSNHVGLYAEEINPTGEALGNFPQAFTHLSLISACTTMDKMLNRHPGQLQLTPRPLYGDYR